MGTGSAGGGGGSMDSAAVAAFLEEPEDTPERRRLQKRKAKNTRDRYYREKRKCFAALALARKLERPCCEYPVKKRVGPLRGKMGPCGSTWKLEIDHVWEEGRKWEAADVAGASRWAVYLEDLAAWQRGEGHREVRFLCPRHSRRHLPTPYAERAA
jgi:hypothetical protein